MSTLFKLFSIIYNIINYYSGYDDPKYLVEQENLEEWETANHRGVITWDTSTLDAAYVKVEFYVIL